MTLFAIGVVGSGLFLALLLVLAEVSNIRLDRSLQREANIRAQRDYEIYKQNLQREAERQRVNTISREYVG